MQDFDDMIKKRDNKNSPLLTVVVPVHNGKAFIEQTLNCLEELSNLIFCELIFQNCKSDDGTTEIIESFCKDHSNRFHYNEIDKGQSDAINKGMMKASGHWVTWLCSDDIILPDLAEILHKTEEDSYDIIYGDAIFCSSSKATPALGTENYKKGILAKKRLMIQQPGTCILLKVWNEMGGVSPNLNWCMDYDLFLRMESVGKRFKRMEAYIALIRIHPKAKTSSGSFKRFCEITSILWQSHKRTPNYFRLRPYLTYFCEYLAKALESKENLLPNFVIRNLKIFVHGLFWMIARPKEAKNIMNRFNNLPSRIRAKIYEFSNF